MSSCSDFVQGTTYLALTCVPRLSCQHPPCVIVAKVTDSRAHPAVMTTDCENEEGCVTNVEFRRSSKEGGMT